MKPLNLDNKPCSPISSNCVVWQGPTLDCIDLCTGDTISDVVAKLAEELCTILDQTNVSNYDLSCLGITSCGPVDFKALIQLLIEKICELQGVTPTETTSSSTCPDCVVTVASCFQVDGATTMQLLDYVQMIANKVCALIDQIGELQTQISNLDVRVTALENKTDPTFTLPSILVNCTLDDGVIVAGNAYSIDEVLNALVNDDVYGYCALLGATGLPSELLSAVATQCVAGADITLDGGVPFSTLGGWAGDSPSSIAGAITNLWLVVCDTYNYLNKLSFPESIVTSTDNTVTVADTTVGTVTTYDLSVPQLPVIVVQGQPASLTKTTPSLGGSRLCDGAVQVNTNLLFNDFGSAYDIATGVFTVPEDGLYTISFFQHMSITTGTGWFDAATPGQLTAGIAGPTGCFFYCVNNFTPVVISKHASINGSLTTFLSAGTEICLRVINTSAVDYITQVGDTSRFSVQRVKF
jgi:hypothetical protein